MDLTISSLTSHIEAIQREIVEIQGYIACRPEASASIDRRSNNISIDSHRRTSIDEATNRGRLVPKGTSDKLQKIENTTATMKDKWRRGDEAIRDFTDSTKDTKVDQPVNYVTLAEITRVAPLSGTVIKTVLRENHQIALFSASFVPAGPSPFQCNSRPDEFGIFSDPDGYAKAIDGHALQVSREDIADILQMANGAYNLFMQQHNVPAHQQRVTNEFYDTAGDVKNLAEEPMTFMELDEHIIRVSKDDIRSLLERASRDEHNYICLPEHANSFTQTKLVLEIYTKDEIKEMFYGVCGAQEKNESDFQMKLDGICYPLNDSISWLTTCMEEMRQDIAMIQTQRASEATAPASIDSHHSTSIDDDPQQSHSMKSQPDFHTIAEINQLVEEIYRTLETTEERLDRRCDDIYFPMDLTMSFLTSQTEAIQREIVEI
ncbi:hypothetical protein DY000_02020040 [Brassica cretica]|uniref:Uncharacterized protein n=1 Tax=Brassica cretica TaxID=69181 RepID=A0ABQ7EBJ5_BRACR|nr:hypothetical protein DY000_02020040 [Brassica cretica]